MAHFKLSAFADEISPIPSEQVRVLGESKVKFIEFRSIHSTNVLDLSDAQIQEFKSLIHSNGIGLSAIGSPIGKIKADQPFEQMEAPALELFAQRPTAETAARIVELAFLRGTDEEIEALVVRFKNQAKDSNSSKKLRLEFTTMMINRSSSGRNPIIFFPVNA